MFFSLAIIVIRMIPGLKNLKYEDTHRDLNLWTLEDRRVRADLIEVFKIVGGQ